MELKVRVNRSIKEFHAQRYLVRDPDDLAECLSSRLLITEPSDTSTGEEEGAVRESTQEAERASNQDSGYASNSNTGHADLDEEHLAAATLRFLDQAGLLRRFWTGACFPHHPHPLPFQNIGASQNAKANVNAQPTAGVRHSSMTIEP